MSAALLTPFMPESAEKIAQQIGACVEDVSYENAGRYGVLPKDVTVHKGATLFPRIDMQKELEELAAQQAAAHPQLPKYEGVAEQTNNDRPLIRKIPVHGSNTAVRWQKTPDGLPNIPTALTRTPPTRWDCCMTSDELPVSVESATSLTDMTA